MLGSLPSFARLVAELSKLPGVGGKTAARLAFHLLRTTDSDVEALADALLDMKRKVRFCSRCFHIAEEELCQICSDPGRESQRLCIVQEPQDLLAIERSHAYRGLYHVLHGALSPLDGIGPEDLKIPQLLQRLQDEQIEEVMLATNFTVEGEATALYLAKLCKEQGAKVTRLAHGIPSGSDLEYIDAGTVQQAVSGRREL
ncbi:DNA replication and repair protein RecR [Malonomonas rubra DSM 5091]|uniref:Recombination protein RecR n=1 Tax=Malonomonas rubra DSM 5091 TaxID=1122189 RepID=A0A1M6LA86_MALRU|nr:recombination mediator RecR [Malonomonas rubra]SHJ68117.1 DNA replication and repair protein RecR [Malonomonas rubra DSM 5091]